METRRSTDAPAAETPSFRRVLGRRPFALLWTSQLISQSGDFVFEVALLWLVLELTGSVFAVGVIVTATLVPAVALGPLIGVYVDRWPRRAILLVANLVQGVLVAGLSGLVLLHAADLALLTAVVLALTSVAQFVRVTAGAMVPQTVEVSQLGAANGLMSFSTSLNQVVGLSIGGVVVAIFNVAPAIEYDALTFFVAAGLVMLIPPAVGEVDGSTAGPARSFFGSLSEGFRYLRGQRFLLELIVLGLVANFFANAVSAVFAPYAALTLHGGPTTYGALGALIAAGGLVGALAIGRVNTRRSAGRYLFAGAAVSGGMFVLLGLTTSIPLALLEAGLMGIFLAVTNVPMLTLIQAKVPARLMGRVSAALTALLLLASPLGSFFAGSLAARTSIGFEFVLSGLVLVAVCAIGAVVFRELRQIAY